MMLKCSCGSEVFIRLLSLNIEKNTDGDYPMEERGLKCVDCSKVISPEEIKKCLKT